MNNRIISSFFGLWSLATVIALAVKTHEVHHFEYTDFVTGKLEGLSLSQYGELQLGMELKEIAELSDAIIFDAVADSNGHLYIATGNKGNVYKLDNQGMAEVLFAADEILVRTLAIDSNDNLYVGTAPEGRVYRLHKDRNPEVFFDPKTKFIWDLQVDAKDNLYVTTGSPAALYRLPPDYNLQDEVASLVKTAEEHLTVIAVENSGSVLVGSSPSALIYRVDPVQEQVEVLHNANAEEIAQMFSDETGIIFTTIRNANGTSETTPMDLPALLAQAQSIEQAGSGSSVKVNNSGNASAPNPQNKPNPPISYVYRLHADGFVEPIWSPGNANLFAMLPWQFGAFLFGTDTYGRLFQVSASGDWSLYQQAPKGGDVSAIMATGGQAPRTFVLTSNPAVVYQLQPSLAQQGSFISQPVDARQTARWGHFRLSGATGDEGQGLQWMTRSGNIPVPDETWSEWAVTDNLQINSPMGRYLQYKIEFSEFETVVDDIRLFYSYQNAAPIVTRLKVFPVGIQVFNIIQTKKPNINLMQWVRQKNSDTTITNTVDSVRQQFQIDDEQGRVTFAWEAIDANGDALVYQLALKKEHTDDWVVLAEDLEGNAYSMSTRGYADGYYRVKLIADDSRANLAGTGRSGQRVSHPFLMDNGHPEIELTQQSGNAQAYSLAFKVEDGWSLIADAEYQLDGQPGRQALPDDIHFDQQQEAFTINLEELSAGVHSLIFYVIDESNNRASQAVTFAVEQ